MLTKVPRWVMIGSVLLAACAGYVNCVALLGFANQAVSHVTGNVTAAANDFAAGDLTRAGRTALIILAFFSGAVVSGFVVKSEALRMGRRYGVALVIESALLFAAAFLFLKQNFLGELAASAACGLQNAMVATYSGSVIRTTHLTGIVSDLGAAAGSFLRTRDINLRAVKLQAAIAVSFTVGCMVGVAGYRVAGPLALLAPAATILTAAIIYTLRYNRAAAGMFTAADMPRAEPAIHPPSTGTTHSPKMR